MEVNEPLPPIKTRRPSITQAGESFRVFFASQPDVYGPGPGYIQDLERFMDTFNTLTKSVNKFKGIHMTTDHNANDYRTQVIEGNIYHNVGIIGLYRNLENPSSGHAVAYVKMNDRWYVGDDEKGILVSRKNGPPTWQTIYSKTWRIIGMYYFYISEILPVCPIPNLNRYGFHGKITFKQHRSSCWGDSIQTVIMNANGFREQFVHLYALVKSTPGIFSGPPNEILDKCMTRLSGILSIQPSRYNHTSNVHRVILVLSLSFIRMVSWEPPYNTYEYVNHIQGRSGDHLLQQNSSEGGEPGTNLPITHPFGGNRSNRSNRSKHTTRKRKN